MKSRLILLLISILFTFSLQAQVVINEISYNPPESGNDSLEYIEIFNAGNAMVNIGGWHFTSAVEDTFPDVDLNPGEYFVTAINAAAMFNVFGIQAHQWTAGALNNTGELIELVDAGGLLVDSVRYADNDPWPTEPDGNGPSLELIDSGLDNGDAANWQICGKGTGIIINGNEVYGTPGEANSGGGTGGPDVTVEAAHLMFHPKHAVLALGETIRWVNNEADFHNVNGDQSVYPDNPAGFTNGLPQSGPWQYDYTPALTGLYNYQCDPHAGQGMTGTMSVYDPNAYTDFPLAHLRLTDGVNGQHIFDGVPTRVEGIVSSINYQPSGYSFYVVNAQNVGINIFSFDPGSYNVAEGDLVRVSGVIDQFNGLLELIPDDIEVLASAQPLTQSVSIGLPDESVEGSLVNIFPIFIDSIIATGTSGYNIFAKNSADGELLVRLDIDSGIDTSGLIASSQNGILGVEGIGTQFDNSFPFTSGYQVLVRFFDVLPGFPVLREDAIALSPNPASQSFALQSDYMMEQIELFSLDGKLVTSIRPNQTQYTIDVAAYQHGIFVVKVRTTDGYWISRVLIQE